MTVRRINIANAPAPGGAYSQAVAANGFLYTAGTVPVDPATGKVAGTDVAAQTEQVMRNLRALLESEGLGFADVVKATVHLTDIERDFAEFNRVYKSHFTGGLPARTTVGSAMLNILVEIDLVVAYPETA
ncbi:RidA family protein [Actinomadura darangshiensis]|uniref:RidA family protein n=1 Tax=Actinomadura darangshiensis TaxID=705336 RepID=A0A4R5BQX4_9ACTN|nr:Rid family detoxifying hydrolase [Actinomadura darangshiensis]TDD87640.1 RidA family protein [Actinomadura darangshiensis]